MIECYFYLEKVEQIDIADRSAPAIYVSIFYTMCFV